MATNGRSGRISDVDYDACFSEEDSDYLQAFDAIDSLHSTPTKPTQESNRSQDLSIRAGSSFPPTQLYPVTPSRERNGRTAITSTSQIRHRLKEMGVGREQHPPLRPRTLFNRPNISGQSKIIVIESSDEDISDDEGRVLALLTDTEVPSSPATSMSSLGSMDSGTSGWSNVSTTASFSSIASSSRKRDGQSPSKYRKVEDDPNSQTCTSAHRARKITSPRPIPTRTTPSRPAVVEETSSDPPPPPAVHDHAGVKPKLRIRTPAPMGPSPIEQFLNGPIGIDLPVAIIAHDSRIQTLLDNAQIAWGVQFELARGVSMGFWEWSAVENKINQLKGVNADVAYRVRNIIQECPLKGIYDTSLWRELDREQLAIIENLERGLGVMGEWQGEPNWHGGQIQQLARLVKIGDSYKIHLDASEKRRSHRLARYLSSRRVIQLRVSKEFIQNDLPVLRAYLTHKFILCGRVFVPLHSKDKSVYLVETNENWERQSASWCGDQYRRSFQEIIQWHNPLDLNHNQPISKWATRFALALSNSIPALIFEEENIFHIDDIYASGLIKGKKAPSHMIMTDGCGFINSAAMVMITRRLGLQSRCTAVQARIRDAKGLFIVHPADDDPEPKIWIRTSQSKITYPCPVDRAHLILDLLSVSRFVPPSINLTKQSIINLAYNGVPHEVLVSMMEQGLIDSVKPLMDWDGQHAMLSLWHTINKLGNVSGSRIQRFTAGLSRAMGLSKREWGSEDIEAEDDRDEDAFDDPNKKPSFTGRNEDSGLPLAMYEASLELIQAGFRPDSLTYLREKIRHIVRQTIKNTVDQYQIPLPLSLNAYIVPDPLGVLKEGEIYYRYSQSVTDPVAQTVYNVLTGDVLLGRYPVRLPSDLQKVKAVDIPALFNWPDVLIVSTKGPCSLASLLSGGDCDGDELFVIREASIVEPFQNKPLTPMPEGLIRDNFEGHVESVTAFAERVTTMKPREAQQAFQDVLSLNIDDAKIGLYSGFHDFAVYRYGYNDYRSIRVAYMFNTLLDSSKTGLRLKDGIFEADKKQLGGEIPTTPPTHNVPRPFILHSLHSAGKAQGDRLLCQYEGITGQNAELPDDADLRAPYKLAMDHALAVYTKHKNKAFTDELDRIRAHVERAFTAFQAACRASAKNNDLSPKKKQKKFQRDAKDPMDAAAQLFSQDVEGILLIRNVNAVKASCAYHRSSHTVFPFTVAFQDLCDIKAHAQPRGVAPNIRLFDEVKNISSSYSRAFARVDMGRP